MLDRRMQLRPLMQQSLSRISNRWWNKDSNKKIQLIRIPILKMKLRSNRKPIMGDILR
jgi:hypothetical protein